VTCTPATSLLLLLLPLLPFWWWWWVVTLLLVVVPVLVVWLALGSAGDVAMWHVVRLAVVW
jgi:hypothetical protein